MDIPALEPAVPGSPITGWRWAGSPDQHHHLQVMEKNKFISPCFFFRQLLDPAEYEKECQDTGWTPGSPGPEQQHQGQSQPWEMGQRQDEVSEAMASMDQAALPQGPGTGTTWRSKSAILCPQTSSGNRSSQAHMAVLASTGKVSAEPAEDFLALQVAADLTPFLFLTFRVFLFFCFGFGYFFLLLFSFYTYFNKNKYQRPNIYLITPLNILGVTRNRGLVRSLQSWARVGKGLRK